MATKQGGSGGKHRTKGSWVAIAQGRSHRDAVLINGRGLSNIPKMGEHGSAAYRRLMAAKARHGHGRSQ